MHALHFLSGLRPALLIAFCLTLSGCGIPYDEHLPNAYDKVSGDEGTVYFVPSLRLRDANYLEAGHSATKTVGASVAALHFDIGPDGAPPLGLIASKVCESANLDLCDSVITSPMLDSGSERLVLKAINRKPDKNTIAWSDMRDFELDDEVRICSSKGIVSTRDFRVLKVTPDAALKRLAYTVYAATKSGPKPSNCIDVSEIGLEQLIGRRGDPAAKFYLSDLVIDQTGAMHFVILTKANPLALDPLAISVINNRSEWIAVDIDPNLLEEPRTPFVYPGFLGGHGDMIIIDARNRKARDRMDFQIFSTVTKSGSKYSVKFPDGMT